MKYFCLVITIFIFSCSSGPSNLSQNLEKETLDCWSETWTKKDAKTLYDGFEALDNYLFSKGLLGTRTIEDYKHFATDTSIIEIPNSVENFNTITLSFGYAWPGSPDLSFAKKCLRDIWFAKMDKLDSTDVLLRVGKMMKEFSDAGAPDFNILATDFFKNLTIDEFNRPLIKTTYYFFLTQKKFKFILPGEISDPNAPPPPPIPGH